MYANEPRRQKDKAKEQLRLPTALRCAALRNPEALAGQSALQLKLRFMPWTVVAMLTGHVIQVQSPAARVASEKKRQSSGSSQTAKAH